MEKLQIHTQMNAEELELLLSPAVRAWILAHREASPFDLAMKKHPVGFPARLAISQISLLQKAIQKLPTWAANACILPARAYEQATSESLAEIKPWGRGAHALDLSCGLGSDDRALAARYAAVLALEPDAALRAVVQANMATLDINNVTLLADRAEEFVAHYDGPAFDLIYIDPDRRDDQGRRQYGLRDGQPDVIALLPSMLAIGKRILIKASPMLDLTAVEAQLQMPTTLWVAAEGNECKELLIEIDPQQTTKQRGAIFIRKGKTYQFKGIPNADKPQSEPSQTPAFVFEADASLYKAGLAAAWYATHGNVPPGGMCHADGYYFSAFDAPDFHGHRFKVLAQLPFKPMEIKRYCKEKGISRIQYSRRDFDLPLAQVRTQLQLPEGGQLYLLLSRMGNAGRVAFVAERID